MAKALLALEDGRVFEGTGFGAEVTATGEACFNTSMTGYQEVLTDPSYRGQIVAMTYPLIGNYGVNRCDDESMRPHVRGFVVEELCDVPSNWRSQSSLDDYLKHWGIPGIQGIDTRALTRHLRTAGACQAAITTDPSITAEDAVRMAKNAPPMQGSDFVKEVSAAENFRWDPEDILSREWAVENPNLEAGSTTADEDGQHYRPLPDPKYHIVAYDFGIKYNMLRRLRQHGFTVDVVNSRTSAEEVLKLNPDGVFLSNGPGDPGALDYIFPEIRKVIEAGKPMFAICLGHQLMAHALGGQTFKLKFGHRGGNQPVQDLRSGKVAITSQNHGFAVAGESLPNNVEVTHVNLNDRTVEGIRHKECPAFSVQYHPEAAPGPNDASYFFNEFAQLIETHR